MAQDLHLRAKEFGPKLRAVREDNGATPKQVATRLGVTVSAISKWETGEVFPSKRKYVEHYANELGGGQELLALYDHLAALRPGDKLTDSRVAGQDLIVGGDYEINDYQVIFVLPDAPGGYMREIAFRELTALRDGVITWKGTTGAIGSEDQARPASSLVLLKGDGTLKTTLNRQIPSSILPKRFYINEYTFTNPLSKGERAGFTTLRSYPADFERIMKIGKRHCFSMPSIKTAVEQATITVCFPSEIQPRWLWHFGELPELLAPAEWDPDKALKMIEGSVSFTWQKLRKGYSYGIVCAW